MLYCGECRGITDPRHFFQKEKLNLAIFFYNLNLVIGISSQRIFGALSLLFSVKVGKNFSNVKKKGIRNEQTFLNTSMMTKTIPPPKEKISSAVRIEIATFGFQIQCVIHSANTM